MSASDRQDRARDAVQRTARKLVDATANGPAPMTMRQALDRTIKARERGDQIRRESGSS